MQSNLEKKAEYLAMQRRSIFQCETERRKNILENGWKKRKKRVFLESLSDASRGREGTPYSMHRTISQLIETENEERERKKTFEEICSSSFRYFYDRPISSFGMAGISFLSAGKRECALFFLRFITIVYSSLLWWFLPFYSSQARISS